MSGRIMIDRQVNVGSDTEPFHSEQKLQSFNENQVSLKRAWPSAMEKKRRITVIT